MRGKVYTPRYQKHFPPPDELEEGILYISREYECTTHRCPCGCGAAVFLQVDFVGPGSNTLHYVTDKGVAIYHGIWKFTDHGDGTITLDPSIQMRGGCNAHYSCVGTRSSNAFAYMM